MNLGLTNKVKSFLSKSDLHAIAEAIAEAERQTSGEIRVAIRQKRGNKERGMSVEILARHEFARLGMIRTAERTGVLLFILLEDRSFYILADEHINERVAPGTWESIAGEMAQRFGKAEYRDGLIAGVKAVAAELKRHFPIRKGDKNELSNEVALS